MLRGISAEDIASALGIFAHCDRMATIPNMVEYLSSQFKVSESYAEARLNELINNAYDFIIKEGVIELFDHNKYKNGKTDALLEKPTRMLSKDYMQGYRDGKELINYLSRLGLKVIKNENI